MAKGPLTKPTKTRDDLVELEQRIADSMRLLRETVQAAYPPGIVVRVQKGRSNVQTEVTHYPGSNPAVFSAFNLKTGINTTYHWRDVQEVLGKRGPQGSIVPLED